MDEAVKFVVVDQRQDTVPELTICHFYRVVNRFKQGRLSSEYENKLVEYTAINGVKFAVLFLVTWFPRV